ncbi:MAG TPA: aminotransferase class V-fold PLP-dependent enzyme, partial [Chloroflexota bacterium]|nr:aminotransferase class V-fold PLP-dependent enzyme [Chloroflexota bacterium]
MLPFMGNEAFGNASSPHARGRLVSRAVERARAQVSNLVKTEPQQVVFTSGATEALNTVLKGLAAVRPAGRDVLVVSAVEHKAVLETAVYLHRACGVRVVVVAPSGCGQITTDAVGAALDEHAGEVFALAVMAVNNETGVVQPFDQIAAIAADRGVQYVCDATQAVGFGLPQVGLLPGATFAALSAHKIQGPQGVGALVMPPRSLRPPIVPLIHGGGHEQDVRAGTINVPGVVGFGSASEHAAHDPGQRADRLKQLRKRLLNALADAVGAEPTVRENLAP